MFHIAIWYQFYFNPLPETQIRNIMKYRAAGLLAYTSKSGLRNRELPRRVLVEINQNRCTNTEQIFRCCDASQCWCCGDQFIQWQAKQRLWLVSVSGNDIS
nr:hypothetical protein [Escherichia coli]